jgi:hypothetical protein
MPSFSYTYCRAGSWSTIFRGPLIAPFFAVYARGDSVGAMFDYSAWSVSPIFARQGTETIQTTKNIWIGATPYTELKVKPKRDCYLRCADL